jgi:hypothetical protein
LALILVVPAVAINLLPGTPGWQKGFLTGVFAMFFVSCVWWLTWVPSGLAARSMGPLAEEWTNDALRGAPGVQAVIPSLKYEGRDVDHVVIASAGIVAVETKWRSAPPSPSDIQQAAEQAAAAGRTLRLNMHRKELADHLFRSAVIYWGPGARDVVPNVIQTSHGPVDVLPGRQASQWLAGLRSGPIGVDDAESLHAEFHQLAVARDRTALSAGPVLRWLARTK